MKETVVYNSIPGTSPPVGVGGKVLSATVSNRPWQSGPDCRVSPVGVFWKVFSLHLRTMRRSCFPGGTCSVPLCSWGKTPALSEPAGFWAVCDLGSSWMYGKECHILQPGFLAGLWDPDRQSSASPVSGSNWPLLPYWKSVTGHKQEENGPVPTVLSPQGVCISSDARAHHNNNKRCRKSKPTIYKEEKIIFSVFYKKS